MQVGNFESLPGPRADMSVVQGPRIIRDGNSGEITTVVERRAVGVAGARGSCCLVISTELGFTRLWEYPQNWSDLNDRDLLALFDRPRCARSA